jgi:hypothetical protein
LSQFSNQLPNFTPRSTMVMLRGFLH